MSREPLDVLPSRPQASALFLIATGDRPVREGRGCRWEKYGTRAPELTVRRLVRNQWINPPHPDGPLFGHAHDGRLTPRGERALERARHVYPCPGGKINEHH